MSAIISVRDINVRKISNGYLLTYIVVSEYGDGRNEVYAKTREEIVEEFRKALEIVHESCK